MREDALRIDLMSKGVLMAKNTMTAEELRSLPVTIPIVVAGRAFGLSRDGVYDLRRRGAFPCRTITVGRATVVARAELLRVLGVNDDAVGEAA